MAFPGHMSRDLRKYDFVSCDKQRRTTPCASTPLLLTPLKLQHARIKKVLSENFDINFCMLMRGGGFKYHQSGPLSARQRNAIKHALKLIDK